MVIVGSIVAVVGSTFFFFFSPPTANSLFVKVQIGFRLGVVRYRQSCTATHGGIYQYVANEFDFEKRGKCHKGVMCLCGGY